MNTLFVYGTLKRGYNNHVFLEGAEFVGDARTRREFSMTGTAYPFVHERPALYPIAGEVFRVSDATLDRIDELEDHPVEYVRREVAVECAGRDETAWMYVAPEDAAQAACYPSGVWPPEG